MSNNKTLETALFSLSAGCLVISIYEIISRGLSWGYLWLMLSVSLWLGYTILKRKRQAAEGPGSATEKGADPSKYRKTSGKKHAAAKAAKGSAASKSGRKRT